MKAAVYRTYGPPEVLRLEEIPTPALSEAHADRVLVRVRYSSINPLDHIQRGGFFGVRPSAGLLKPKPAEQTTGADLAGEVVAIGGGVSRFKVGDRVFGNAWGSHAEYVLAREQRLTLLPPGLSFKAAAALPVAALTALQALRDVAGIQPGHKVLINGASGGVGHFAVQLAKHFGAEVTAVCSSANQGWVRALGADHMVDYSSKDFTKSTKRYDIIYDTVGKRTYWSCRPLLTPGGVFVGENPFKARFQLLQLAWAMLTRDKQLRAHLTTSNAKDLGLLAELAGAGRLEAMVERVYPLEQIVQAHRHGETGRTKGKLVIEVSAER
ncbi:MAG: NAD(P)-dependent alcohol dehydrogenase [Meiothermus sp.]|nr:NAD(P)-dependent alcohol dehydrogenase [Meiothermus sp.]